MVRPIRFLAVLSALALLVACRPPSALRELVGKDPATPATTSETVAAEYPAPDVPERPASLSFGALVHTNEVSWEALVDKSVEATGVLVLDVLPGTPAAEAGLQRGDVITGIDGRTVNNQNQLVTAFQLTRDGRHSLVVQKVDGETETIDAQLAEAPDLALLSYLEQKVVESPDPVFRFLLADRVLDHARAVDIYRGLVAEFPEFAVGQALLAKRLVSQMESVAGDAPVTTLGATPEIEEARSLINAAVEEDPSAASIYLTRAQIYLSLDESEQAESDALTALEMDTQAAHAYFLIGTARLVQDRAEEALLALHEAVAQDPFVVQYYYNLALCYRALGLESDAAQTIEAGKALTDDVNVRQSLDSILEVT